MNGSEAPRRGRLRVALAAVLAVLLVSAATCWNSAFAAFVRTTATGSNSWTTGTVTFGANSPATALFTVTGAWPGSTGNACVKISYTGSLAAGVRLYVAPGGLTGTGLGTYLSLQINEGTGNSSDCSDFVKSATTYNATGTSSYAMTLAAFAAASTNYGSGASAWSPSGSATRTYQVVYFVQPYNAAVSKSASVVFTWEAQS